MLLGRTSGWKPWGPFYRTDPLDLLAGAGSSEGEDDLGDASPGDSDLDDGDRTRPDEYSESGDFGEDLDDITVEDDDPGDEDGDILDGRDPDRSWESIAKEERRRYTRLEDKLENLVVQMAQNQGVRAAPAEAPKPQPPPTTPEEIAAAYQEGDYQKAVRMQSDLDDWKENRLRGELRVEQDQRAEVSRVETRLRSQLNVSRDTPEGKAVIGRREELMQEFPGLGQTQATLWAWGEVGRELTKQRREKPRDMRDESKRRNARKRPRSARDTDRRAPSSQGKSLRISSQMMEFLDKSGLGDYVEKARSSNPEIAKRYKAKIRRLTGRIEEVNEG